MNQTKYPPELYCCCSSSALLASHAEKKFRQPAIVFDNHFIVISTTARTITSLAPLNVAEAEFMCAWKSGGWYQFRGIILP